MKRVAVLVLTVSIMVMLFCGGESAESGGGPKLCAANGIGLQRLSLHASGTESCWRRSSSLLGYVDRADETKVIKVDGARKALRLIFSFAAAVRHGRDFIYLDEISGADHPEWQLRISPRYLAVPLWSVDDSRRQFFASHLRHARRSFRHRQYGYPLREQDQIGWQGTGLWTRPQ